MLKATRQRLLPGRRTPSEGNRNPVRCARRGVLLGPGRGREGGRLPAGVGQGREGVDPRRGQGVSAYHACGVSKHPGRSALLTFCVLDMGIW